MQKHGGGRICSPPASANQEILDGLLLPNMPLDCGSDLKKSTGGTAFLPDKTDPEMIRSGSSVVVSSAATNSVNEAPT